MAGRLLLRRDGFERLFVLDPGEEALVGRSLEAKLLLLDGSVSRQHCKIRATASGFEVEDLGSRNECSINGRRISQRVLLSEGAILKFGNLAFTVARIEAPEPPVCSRCGQAVADTDCVTTSDGFVVCPTCHGELESPVVEGARAALAERGMKLLAELGRDPPTFRVDRAGVQLIVHVVELPTQNPDAVEALRDGVRTLASLRHEAIATVQDLVEAGPLLLICSREPAGEPLEARVRREGPLPRAQAVDMARRLASAVSRATRSGVVHREIVPANVFVDRSGHTTLANFSVVRDLSQLSRMTRSFHAAEDVERLMFLAPECVLGGADIDARADIFGIGSAFIFALAGRPAWGMASNVRSFMSRLIEQGAPPRLDLSGLPADVVAVLEKLLEPDPARRLADPLAAEKLLGGLPR